LVKEGLGRFAEENTGNLGIVEYKWKKEKEMILINYLIYL
jgi:hypothetical protein